MNLTKLIDQKRKDKLKKERAKKAKGIAIGTTLGITAGLASGLLFAPKSGKETREGLKKSASDLNSTFKNKTEDIKLGLSDAKNQISKYIGSKKANKEIDVLDKSSSNDETVEIVKDINEN